MIRGGDRTVISGSNNSSLGNNNSNKPSGQGLQGSKATSQPGQLGGGGEPEKKRTGPRPRDVSNNIGGSAGDNSSNNKGVGNSGNNNNNGGSTSNGKNNGNSGNQNGGNNSNNNNNSSGRDKTGKETLKKSSFGFSYYSIKGNPQDAKEKLEDQKKRKRDSKGSKEGKGPDSKGARTEDV